MRNAKMPNLKIEESLGLMAGRAKMKKKRGDVGEDERGSTLKEHVT